MFRIKVCLKCFSIFILSEKCHFLTKCRHVIFLSLSLGGQKQLATCGVVPHIVRRSHMLTLVDGNADFLSCLMNDKRIIYNRLYTLEATEYIPSAVLTYVATVAWPQGPALLGAPRFCQPHFQNLLCAFSSARHVHHDPRNLIRV